MIIVFTSFFLFYIISSLVCAIYVFIGMHVRTFPGKWRRTGNFMKDPEYAAMFKEGNIWAEENKSFVSEEFIQNDGFKLCAQYFDFGYSKAVIIVPGLNASCNYSYYYAMPYKERGYNVLAIDTRSHGYSEGKYNTVGYKEYSDILAWGRFLRNEKKNNFVVLHGICVGSSATIFAISKERKQSCFNALVVEGVFINYYNHYWQRALKQFHIPPVLNTFFFACIMKYVTGVNIKKSGPIDCVGNIKIPVLFLHGKKDRYSLPKYIPEMFSKCRSKTKKLVWFEKGRHSFLRYTNKNEYDNAIFSFLKEVL